MYLSVRDVQTNKCVCLLDSPISGFPALNQIVTMFSATHHHITSKVALSSHIQVLDAIASAALPRCTDRRRRLRGS